MELGLFCLMENAVRKRDLYIAYLDAVLSKFCRFQQAIGTRGQRRLLIKFGVIAPEERFPIGAPQSLDQLHHFARADVAGIDHIVGAAGQLGFPDLHAGRGKIAEMA